VMVSKNDCMEVIHGYMYCEAPVAKESPRH
jgi:hypothetical protein